MPTLLNIQSSPNLFSSGSRAVSKAFVDNYVAAHPGTKVIDLDLVLDPPPHFGTRSSARVLHPARGACAREHGGAEGPPTPTSPS